MATTRFQKTSLFVTIGLAAVVGCATQANPTLAPSTAPAAVLAGATMPGGHLQEEHPVIVRIVSRDAIITATATADGPRYSATTAAGEALIVAATLDELRDSHPDLYRFVSPANIVDASLDASAFAE